MSTTLIEVRPAKAADAAAVASTHDEAWRSAYQGIIPGAELEKLINRRGPQWWDSAIRKGSRITILQFGEQIAGYANYGRNRARSLFYDGEVYELYLRPEFQGLGFGRKLFTAARRDLGQVHRGFNRFTLAEEQLFFARRIRPVFEQPPGHRRDVDIAALTPAIDALADAIDFAVRLDPIRGPLGVEVRLLTFLPRAGDWHEEGARAPLLVDVGGDALVVEPEVPAGRLERRIENGVFDGDGRHGGYSRREGGFGL